MSEHFPPEPDHPSEVASMAEVYATLIADRSAWYVSTPLTTGHLSAEWHATSGVDAANPGYGEAFRQEVMEPNRALAQAFVARVRRDNPTVAVIDPSGLPDIDSWTQWDYRRLWQRVIERYVARVILRDGWELSDGCTFEFYVAVTRGVETVTESMAPLGTEEGMAMLKHVMASRKESHSSSVLATVVTEIDLRAAGHR